MNESGENKIKGGYAPPRPTAVVMTTEGSGKLLRLHNKHHEVGAGAVSDFHHFKTMDRMSREIFISAK